MTIEIEQIKIEKQKEKYFRKTKDKKGEMEVRKRGQQQGTVKWKIENWDREKRNVGREEKDTNM